LVNVPGYLHYESYDPLYGGRAIWISPVVS
jgi:hypothetical protein